MLLLTVFHNLITGEVGTKLDLIHCKCTHNKDYGHKTGLTNCGLRYLLGCNQDRPPLGASGGAH